MHASSHLRTHIHLCNFHAITHTHGKTGHYWCAWKIFNQMSIFISNRITGWKLCLGGKTKQPLADRHAKLGFEITVIIIRHTIFNSNLQRQAFWNPISFQGWKSLVLIRYQQCRLVFSLHRGPRRLIILGYLPDMFFISSILCITAFNFYRSPGLNTFVYSCALIFNVFTLSSLLCLLSHPWPCH